MLHYEAIQFLDEIANTNPEILQSASYIDLKLTSDEEVEIVIHCRLASCDLELLNNLANAKRYKITHYPQETWIIS